MAGAPRTLSYEDAYGVTEQPKETRAPRTLSYEDAYGVEPASRSFGDVAGDVGSQLGKGVNTIAGAIPNLLDPSSPVSKFFNDNAQYWQNDQSQITKSLEAAADARIKEAAKTGQWEAFKTAVKAYGAEPALVQKLILENIPSMIPGLAAAKGAQIATKGSVIAGTVAGAGTNSLLNAGGARQESYQDIKSTLIAQGVPEAEADAQALEKSKVAAGVGAATGALSGGSGLERGILGGAKGGFAKRAGVELGGEQLEEVAPTIATNMQLDRDMLTGVGETSAKTLIASSPGSVISGFQGNSQPVQPTPPGATPPTIHDAENIDELISATKSSIDVELDNQTNQDLLDEISASNNATSSNTPVDQSYVPQPDTEPRPTINIAPDVQPLVDNAEPLVSGQAQPAIKQSQPTGLSSKQDQQVADGVLSKRQENLNNAIANGAVLADDGKAITVNGKRIELFPHERSFVADAITRNSEPQPTKGQNVQDIIPETQSQPIELAPETGNPVGVDQEQDGLITRLRNDARNVFLGDISSDERAKQSSLIDNGIVDAVNAGVPEEQIYNALYAKGVTSENLAAILPSTDRSQPTVNSDLASTPASTLPSKPTAQQSPPTPLPASAPKEDVQTIQPVDDTLKTFRTEILKYKEEGKTVTGTKTIYDATDRLKAIAEDTGETSLKAQQVWFNSKRKTLEKNGDAEAAALFERIVAQLKERINTAQEPAPVKIDDQVATVVSDVAEKTANVVAPKPKRKVGIPKRMSLLEWVASEGGFNRAEVAAEIGRIDDLKAHRSGILRSPSFRAKGGKSWDDLGRDLSDAGYLPKDEHGKYDKHDLFQRIDAELDGEKQYTADDIEGIAETDKAARELDELRGEAESVGVDWKKYKTIDDLWVAIDAKRFELSDADEALLEDVVADDSADTDFDFGTPVSAAETEAWLNGVEDGQGNQGQANGATAGARGEGDQRSTERSSAQGEAEQQTPDREFALTSQTEEDIKQQEERAADTSIADREAADRASEVPLTLAAQSSSNTGSAANQSSMFTPDGRASKAAESRPADPISKMAASVESPAKTVQALVETQRKPDSGIEISTASIDTLNSWKNYPGVIKSVKGWSLFKDPVYEKFVLMRKAKEANKAGGGYVSAERAGYFDTENQASEWAALNSGQNKTDDVSKKAENVDTSKERVKGIDISKNKVFTDDAAAAARAILKKKLGQLNSGLDPEMMQAGITLAGYHIEKGARTFATFARAMIDDLGDAVKPYLKSWYAAIKFDQRAAEFSSSMDSMAEIEAADVNALTGENNVTDEYSGTDLERDSENTNAENGLGEESISNGRGGNVQRGESGIRGTQEEGGAGSRIGLSGREAATDGERGNLAIYTGATGRGTEDSIAGDSLDQRSNNAGIEGSPIESDAASVTQDVSESGLQLGADKLKQKAADRKEHTRTLENIRLTLPILTEGQQEDVFKAETRFAKEDGYGMLFTNGTGTGKTFTGLGVIKRFFTEGKRNIIIAVPNDKIASDWQKAGTMLGLDISRLEDTNSAGEGVVITTYANYGQNNQLAHRNWDLIVHDEAHYLAMDKDGTNTLALHALRALSLHPDGVSTRHSMLYADDIARLTELQTKLKDDENNASLKAELNKAEVQHRETREKVKNEVADNQGNKRPRALFLSATPFAYVKTVDWANGYLFDYDEGRSKDTSRSYNTGSNANQFFMQHFGYSMRYNKLTQPDAKVDTGLMQRQFNSYLKKNGVLSGRMLDVKADYDRRFVLVDSAVGVQIDAALQWFEEERKANKGNEDKILAIGKVGEVITEKFDYLSRRYLLESIKAKEVLPHVREHLAMGRKVVVFHDYKKGGGFNPFDLSHRNSDDSAAFNEVVDSFRSKFKSLIQSDVWHSSSPITTFQREFPDVLLFNGEISPKQRRANVEKFQDDASGPQVFLVQSQAGKEGISLHDTTGKHQRVLFNLGQPTQPTTAIQQEGRIYRTGQVTDAIFRYLNTGTNWEKWAFATTASRSSAAENLGMGEHARALKDAFIEAFEESDSNRAGMEGEGKGGKERDKAANNALTEYDRARAFYFGTQKKNSRSKSQEGTDYFATPEPVGLTMVQLADIRIGESVLEPSAGHGAIARWMPENAERTAVEPSMSLRPRLAMVFDGKIVDTNFEDLHVSNKYDAIIMNPPFGSAGRTAVDHIAKAATHLRNGGRIVALMPVGSATTKFDKWFYEMEERPVKPLATHPTLGPIYKGDTISSGLAGADDVIAKSAEHGGIMFGLRGSSFSTLTSMEGIYDVKPTGKRTTEFSPAEGLQLVAEIKLPQVTFERAGTAVSTRIIVIEKSGDTKQFVDRDYSDITDINELFDRMENLSIPQRTKAQTDVELVATQKASKPVVDKVAAKEAADAAGLEIIEHTTSKGKVIRGVVRADLTLNQAKEIDKFTFKKNGGYFIREKHLAANNDDPLFSKSTPTQNTHTVTSATTSMLEAHTGKIKSVLQAMLDNGKAKVVTAEEAAEVIGEDAISSDAQAFYNPADEVTYFVADQIPANYTAKEWEGLVLHEIGVHARELGVGQKEFKNILSQIELMAKSGNKKINEAMGIASRALGLSDLSARQILMQGVSRHAYSKSDLLAAKATINKLLDDIEVVFGPFVSGGVSANAVQNTPNRAWMAVKNLADLGVKQPAFPKGFSSVDINRQRVMLSGVRNIVGDDKIFKSIVELLPVDMVNMLTRGKLSFDKAFDNMSMLKNSDSVNSDSSVSAKIDIAGRIAMSIRYAAIYGATNYPIQFSESSGININSLSALSASAIKADPQSSKSASVGTVMLFVPSEFGRINEKSGFTTDTINSRHDVTPVSDDVLGGSVDGTTELPPIISKDLLLHETLAYAIQHSPQLGIAQRVIAWFRNAIRAIGKSFPTLQKMRLNVWANNLNESDLRFMAESALKNAEPSGVQNESDTPQFSKSSQTDTPAFKKWFGESKVVDEEGRPLVVYHGTDADIEAFSTTSKKRTNPLVGSSGIYLTSDSEYASRYAELRGKYKGGARGANVMPVYVRIENPVPNSMIGNYTNITKEQIVDYVSQGYDGIIAGNTNASEIIAFNPSQIKSAIGNNGNFSKSDNNILFSKNTNPITHSFQPENSGKPLDSWIKIFTRNQIVTLYRDSLIGKKLEEYKELRELVTADTNKLFEKADNFLLELRQIPKELRDAFASLAHDSTLNNVDPSNPKYVPSPDAVKLADYLANNPTNQTLAAKIKKRLNNMEAAHKKLHAEFSALPTKEQELFKELRSKYTEQMTMVFDEIKKRIGRTKNVDPAIKISSIKKLDEQLADLLGRVYFPLYRAGNYIVKAEKAGEPTTVDHVESNFAADRLEKKLKKLGYTVSRSTRIVSPQDNKSGEALNAVRDLLDKAALKGKIEGAELSQLMDDIDQTILQSLPDQSYRKSFIHRKGTKGYSDDFIRAYADAMRRGSINIANLRHGDKITTVIEDMRKDVKAASKVPGSNVAALNQVVDRVEQIEVDIRNPTSKLVSVSGKIAFAQMLGSLSNFILNLTQIPLLTMPHLGAEYGYGKANLQLAMAFAKQMRSLKKQGTLSELGKWLDMRHGLVGNELDLMQQLHDSGFLDLTQSFDLIDAANNPSYQENELSMNVMKVIALPQHVSEIVNRQVTALATIRLEMARSGSPLKAYRAAIKAIDETHFNYSKENRSKLMTGNTQSMLFKFKQYPQQAAFLFVHTAKLALDGSTKLDSDGNKLDGTRPSERTKARKQLAGVLGMQILVAGTLGLPVFAEAAVAASGVAGYKLAGSTGAYVGVAGAIILAAALAFGDDDGEEFDVEVKKWFIKNFGYGIGSSLASGVIPRGLSTRLDASELIIRRPEEKRTPTDTINAWMLSLLGPILGGIVYNAGIGVKEIAEGDIAKGATKLIPVKAIKDLVTSWKWANDGMNVTNKDGEIITPVSKADIFFKSIGINPTSVVNAREYDNAKFTLHNALLKKQQKALKELREETDKTKRFNAIIKYNKFAPLGYEIDSDKVRGVIAREIKYKGKPNVVTGNPVQEDYLNKNTKELRPAY